jgi:glutamate-1-semialdehyde aminotransferase
VNEAVVRQLQNGATLSLGTDLEVLCAEKITQMFPFVETVKFLKTGSEACTATRRIISKFFEKKETASIGSEGYHGWIEHDMYWGDPSKASPERTVNIIEPVITDVSKQRIARIRELNDNSFTIFDECVTGFRYKNHSVSNCHGIRPDLIVLGKAIANGLPLAVVGGSRDLMNCGDYFVSSTFAGETLSLAAAIEAMTLLKTKIFDIDELWDRGEIFLDGFNSLLPGLKIEGYPTRGAFKGDELTKALFWQEAVKAGILFGPSFFLCFPHLEHLDQILNICSDIATRIKTGMVKLEGEMPKSPIAQEARNG